MAPTSLPSSKPSENPSRRPSGSPSSRPSVKPTGDPNTFLEYYNRTIITKAITRIVIVGSTLVTFVGNMYYEFAWNGKLSNSSVLNLMIHSFAYDGFNSIAIVGSNCATNHSVIGIFDI